MALQAFGPANEIAPAPSLIGSLQAGAALGTQLRGQDIAENEAKDRLSLAYAQLQSQEKRAAEQAQAKLTLAHATLKARQRQQDLMAGYREQALKQQEERNQAQAAASGANLDLRERQFAEKQAAGEADGTKWHFGTDGEVLKINPNGDVEQKRPPRDKSRVQLSDGKFYSVKGGDVQEITPKAAPAQPEPPQSPSKVLGALRSLFGGGASPSLQLPQSGVITDSKGKKWKYTGSMSDPKKDRDESHWEEAD